MRYIWIARVIDGSDFDRVAYEGAFLSASTAREWLAHHYEECVGEEEPAYRSGWRTDLECLVIMDGPYPLPS